jgi:tetracycline resistance efflux pump
MQNTWLVLLPPLLVLVIAFITKRVLFSLGWGIGIAALIAASGNPLTALLLIGKHTAAQLNVANLYIFGFLTALGILITLIAHAGGSAAYSNLIKRFSTTKTGVELATVGLSLCMLFDDFFSSITVGCIMRPLTDHFKIPRAKLAFLIDSMAAPLVILIPFSSWIAMLIMQLQQAGIHKTPGTDTLIIGDPFSTYLHIIPYIFYSFCIFMTVLMIVLGRFSFGSMAHHEELAEKTGNLYGGKHEQLVPYTTHCPTSGALRDFFIPLLLLLGSIFIALLVTGNYYLFGGTASFLQALINTNIFKSLFFGSVTATLLSWLMLTSKKSFMHITQSALLFEGASMMKGAIIILFAAWIFSSLLIDELHSGVYLAHLLTGAVSPFLLPALFFTISAICSIAIGSSWGTIAVIMPLAVPMLVQLTHLPTPISLHAVPLLLPLLGAIFAGAIAGDHVSPLSSTTLMSSASSGCYHTDHVRTQFTYAVPAGIGALLGFVCAGFLSTYAPAFMYVGGISAALLSTALLLIASQAFFGK